MTDTEPVVPQKEPEVPEQAQVAEEPKPDLEKPKLTIDEVILEAIMNRVQEKAQLDSKLLSDISQFVRQDFQVVERSFKEERDAEKLMAQLLAS